MESYYFLLEWGMGGAHVPRDTFRRFPISRPPAPPRLSHDDPIHVYEPFVALAEPGIVEALVGHTRAVKPDEEGGECIRGRGAAPAGRH